MAAEDRRHATLAEQLDQLVAARQYLAYFGQDSCSKSGEVVSAKPITP